MSNEGNFGYTTGQTLTVILATTSQTYWDGSSLQADYDAAVSTGKLTATEHDGSSIYYFDMPAVASGKYICLVLDSTDTVIKGFSYDWDGSAEVTQQNPTNLTVEGADISIT